MDVRVFRLINIEPKLMFRARLPDLQYTSPDLDSSPDLSPFLPDLHLDSELNRKDFDLELRLLDLDLDLRRFVIKSTFNFHCAHKPYDILSTRIVHTTTDLRYFLNIYCGINTWTCLFRFHLQCIDLSAAGIYCNEKSAQRDANTARALAIVRFGHRLPVANTRVTDRTDNNTLRR